MGLKQQIQILARTFAAFVLFIIFLSCSDSWLVSLLRAAGCRADSIWLFGQIRLRFVPPQATSRWTETDLSQQLNW